MQTPVWSEQPATCLTKLKPPIAWESLFFIRVVCC
jgi:hypothetical protein